MPLPPGRAPGLRFIRDLGPRALIQGHTPLTETFTIEAMPGLEAALTELHTRTIDDLAAGRTLADHGDHALALHIVEAGLECHPGSTAPADLRQAVLHRLMDADQQLVPFRYVVYAELAGSEIEPIR